ncbi:MAG: type I-C CRISPR-associated endonuclease Cas1 [Muribaculaceae bacterium]|nr:type I-C CRISPR-associated endonuclease Cas1 [Muribaculaceae bacterium]
MRKLLNVLYITRPNGYLKKDGLNLVVEVEGEEIFRIPIHNIEGVVTFSYIGASPGAMKLCVDNNVSLSFHSPNGKFIARAQGPTHGNVLLRKRQYRLADDKDFAVALSRIMIAAKIQNYRNIIRRAIRDNGANSDLENAGKRLEWHKNEVLKAQNIPTIMGIEGIAAAEYFGVLPHMIIQQRRDFPFSGRIKHPPVGKVNVMLSFVYTLLAHEMTAALDSVGLDPYVGFMHTLRPGRPSLALDMMEELRAYLGDRLVLSLINRRQITPRDFIQQAEDSITLTDNGRKTIISAWQERKKDEITHPYLNEKIPVGLLPHSQAMLMARYLRGDLDNYPVFILK